MPIDTDANGHAPGKGTLPALRWRWYHGIAFYAIIQVLTFGLGGLTSAIKRRMDGDSERPLLFDKPYFGALRQATFAPPSWAFAPAWTINNAQTIWGHLRVLNMPEDTPGRDAYLALQSATWINFVLFYAAYFSLRSPINALVLTFTYLVLTVARVLVALFGLKDSWVARSLATSVLWLLVATSAAAFQALWNRDDFYRVGPFAEPPAAMLRARAP